MNATFILNILSKNSLLVEASFLYQEKKLSNKNLQLLN